MGRWKGDSTLLLSPPPFIHRTPLTACTHAISPSLPLLWLFRDRLFSAPPHLPFPTSPPKQGPHYVVVYHGLKWSEGGNFVPSCYESFQHTEHSPVVKIEITNTAEHGPKKYCQSRGNRHSPKKYWSSRCTRPIQRNTVGSGIRHSPKKYCQDGH